MLFAALEPDMVPGVYPEGKEKIWQIANLLGDLMDRHQAGIGFVKSLQTGTRIGKYVREGSKDPALLFQDY